MRIPVAPAWNLTNLLSEQQQKMTGSIETQDYVVSGWEAVGANSRISLSTEQSKWTPAALQIRAAAGSGVTIGARAVYDGIEQILGDAEYRAFAWIKTTEYKQQVRVGIEWTVGTSVTYEYTEQEIIKTSDWTLVSFTGTPPSPVAAPAVRVESPDVDAGNEFYVDDAVLVRYYEPVGAFLTLMLRDVPSYLKLLDLEQQSPSQPMLRFVQLVGHTADRMLAASLAFDYIPAADAAFDEELAGTDRSTLVDVNFYPMADLAEERWLPWLAFITGTRPIGRLVGLGSGGSTPWYVLEEIGSPSSWQDLYDGIADPLTWNDIEDFLPAPPQESVGIRDAIRLRGSGILAGTVEGLKRAARLALTGLDIPVTLTRTGNVATATFDSVQTIANGTTMVFYDCADSSFDGTFTVTMAANNLSATFSCPGNDVSTAVNGYMTERIVEIERTSLWEITVKTLAAQTTSNDGALVLQAATKAKPAGCVLAYEQL
jgi:hypothetical protein